MAQSISPFTPHADRFIGMIDQLALADRRTRYTFTSVDDYDRILRAEPRRATQIYWGEILARAHLTAVTAILRSRRWISAIAAAAHDKNLLAFAAALRGLIESAADTSTALRGVPLTLARDHLMVTEALAGSLGRTAFVVGDIEDQLIHYSHARCLKKNENAPASHKARSIRDYIEILEKGRVTEIIDCYHRLCDLTHPGASSVWMWLSPVNDMEVHLATGRDGPLISGLLAEYRKTFLELLMFAFNPAIVTLSVLNYFPVKKFHTPQLLSWDLTAIPLWQKIQHQLDGVGPQVGPRQKCEP